MLAETNNINKKSRQPLTRKESSAVTFKVHKVNGKEFEARCGEWALGPLTGRARVPARSEGVSQANGAFSSLIRVGYKLRERSGSCRTRTRSLPALGTQPFFNSLLG